MKIAIIADDLTGANDTGVQLARNGFSVTVKLNLEPMRTGDEAVVYDTDSRAVWPETAYERVFKLCEQIRKKQPELIYKKLDSTMRGNIGVELDAVYDAFHPDFIVVAPAFPQNGRVLKDGTLYVDGVPVSQTEMARDPQAPVTESDITALLARQTDRSVRLITYRELRTATSFWWAEKLRSLKNEGVAYLVLDTAKDSDLDIAAGMGNCDFRMIWAGSAGLARALSSQVSKGSAQRSGLDGAGRRKVLTVVGSTNSHSRKQLSHLLTRTDVVGVELDAGLLVREGDQQHLKSVALKYAENVYASGKQLALYSSSRNERLEADMITISRRISKRIGEIASAIVNEHAVDGLVLTGGDTAKQVCIHLGCTEMKLMDELETGVPIGTLQPTGNQSRAIRVITKAGGFGSEEVLVKSLESLMGDVTVYGR